MSDERVFELLAAHTGPAAADPDFEDRLFSILQGEMRRRRSPRLVLLLAAALVAIGLVGGGAIGSGLVRLPSVERVPVPTLSATPAASPASVAAGQMLGSHFGHTATLLADGHVLVAGGLPGLGGPHAEVYDPQFGRWTATAEMVEMRDGHTATLLDDGTVLVAGGADGDMRPAHSSAELYDPAQGAWTATGSMAVTRTRHTATLLPDGRVLVAGGEHRHNGVSQASAEIYDPATGAWTAVADMNASRGRHTATLLPSGRVLVAGGTDDRSGPAELYDPARGTWTDAGRMIVNRKGHSAVLLADGRVFVVGGFGITDNGSVSDTILGEVYDEGAGSWASAYAGPLDGASPAVALLPNGTVLTSHAASVDVWDPETGRWTAAPGLRSPPDWVAYTATLLDDGLVLMAGGWETTDAGIGPPSLFERYTPPADGPRPEDAGVISGLDGQAFIAAWRMTGSRSTCRAAEALPGELVEHWWCSHVGEGNVYEEGVMLVGDSLSDIRSIQASVALPDGGPVDAEHAGALFAFVVPLADPDAAAVATWVQDNAVGHIGQRDQSGLTYSLSGPPERRVLKITLNPPAAVTSPFPTPDPARSCVGAYSPAGEADEVPIGPLHPGTYTCHGVGGGGANAQFTVPAGWEWHGWYLSKGGVGSPEEARISFFDGQLQVYTDPCQWSGSEPNPPTGTTVTDLVDALAAQPMRDAGPPTERYAYGIGSDRSLPPGGPGPTPSPNGYEGRLTERNGYEGMTIELDLPDDIDLVDCDAGEFRSWGPDGEARAHQGRGQRDLVWVVTTCPGSCAVYERLVLDASWMPATPAEVRAEIDAIFDSIAIGHWG